MTKADRSVIMFTSTKGNDEMKINTKLTNSQKKAIEEFSVELGDTKITSVNSVDFCDRVRLGIETKCGFMYSLFMGKRGKIYETESGQW